MSEWLRGVVDEGGEWCRNCSVPDAPIWRMLHDREIEQCPNCGDEEYDVYDLAEVYDLDEDGSNQP